MGRVLQYGLMVCGALLGGGIPGCLLAFCAAAYSGLMWPQSEPVRFSANVVFGLAGAVLGLYTAHLAGCIPPRRVEHLTAILAGVLSGAGGYYLFPLILKNSPVFL